MAVKNLTNTIIIFTILAISILCCGCVKYDVEITIDRNGDANIIETRMIYNDVYALYENEVSSYINKFINEQDLNVEKYSENDYTGIKMSYSVKDVAKNDIEKPDSLYCYDTNHESGKFVDVKKHFFATNYDINIVIDYSYNPNTGKKDLEYLNIMKPKAKLKINIPVKANSNNATTIENSSHTYIWEYDKQNPENYVLLNYSVPNILNIILTIIFLTGFIGFICYLIKSKNSNKKDVNVPQNGSSKLCPFCGNEIKLNAKKCRFCGEWLNKE